MAAGDNIYALDLTTAVGDSESGEFTLTITSFGVATTGGTYADCGVAFVAPTSGRVVLHYDAQMFNSGAAASTRVTPVVRTGTTVGSGTSVLASSDNNAVVNTGTDARRYGCHYFLSGLTAGSDYNVRLEHRVGSGTGTIRNRSVTVVPTT